MDFCPESTTLCQMIRGTRRVSGGSFPPGGAFIASCGETEGGLVQQALKLVDEGSAARGSWRSIQSRSVLGIRRPPNERGTGIREDCRYRQAGIGFRCILSLEAVIRTGIECTKHVLRAAAIRLRCFTAARVRRGRGGHAWGARDGSRETRACLDQDQGCGEQHGGQAPRYSRASWHRHSRILNPVTDHPEVRSF